MVTSEEWLRLIAARVHHPASIPEIARRLGIPRDERAAFRAALDEAYYEMTLFLGLED